MASPPPLSFAPEALQRPSCTSLSSRALPSERADPVLRSPRASRSRTQDPVPTPDLEELERAVREPQVDGVRIQPPHDDFEGSIRIASDPNDERASIFAVLSGATRRGSWEPAEHNEVIATMGGVKLDFREADLLEGTTTVRCFTMMGGIHIIVPPDVDVEANGIGLLGGFDHVDHRATEDDVPRIKIEGIALMAGVSVRVKERVDPTA